MVYVRLSVSRMEPNTRRSALFLKGALVGVAYYVGALVGFALKFPSHAPSALWPPNSILLAALLLLPTRQWWVVLLSAFPAHLLVQLPSGMPVVMSLAFFSQQLVRGAPRRLSHPPVDRRTAALR
jgi:integral membrane sensor domain MASE1